MLFLSFAHVRSQQLAGELRDLVKVAFPDLRIHLLPTSQKTNSWRESLFEKLTDTRLAIVCLTHDNYRSRWIHYEVGALRHALGDSRRVVVLKFPSDRLDGLGDFPIEPPLDDLHRILVTTEGIEELIQMIRSELCQPTPQSSELERAIEDFVGKAKSRVGQNVLESSPYLNVINAATKTIASPRGTVFRATLAEQILGGVHEAFEELSRRVAPTTLEEYLATVHKNVRSLTKGDSLPPDARILAICGHKPWSAAKPYFRENFKFAAMVGQPEAVCRIFLEPTCGFDQSTRDSMDAHLEAHSVEALVLPRSRKPHVDSMFPGLFDYMSQQSFACVVMTTGEDSVAYAHRGQANAFGYAKFKTTGSVWAVRRVLTRIKPLCVPPPITSAQWQTISKRSAVSWPAASQP